MTTAQPTAEQQAQARVSAFDTARSNIFTSVGASSHSVDQQNIQALPQGDNQSFEKLLLQLPGISEDSAASGNFHVRDEHANAAIRINGIMLPDGVTGFGSILETGFIGNLTLITGALPAEFGLRTAGVLDLTTRSGAFNNGGSASLYGGSHQTFTPSFEYGGHFGGDCGTAQSAGSFTKAVPGVNCNPGTDYFFTGRYFTSNLGIENPTPSYEAIHDRTNQERTFGYLSTFIDSSTRLSLITGQSVNKFQIPNTPGQPPQFTAFGVSDFDSSLLNENQLERTIFNVLTLQKSANGFDGQISYFNRYSDVHFVPDTIGDLVFNGVASDVFRSTFANGLQGDGSYRVDDDHTVRAGFSVTAEQGRVTNSSVVLPVDALGNPIDAPFGIVDAASKLGWLYGVYVQDEWRLTDQLTLNGGLRFDQMDEFTSENQVSPRISAVYKPFAGTSIHAGYARTFTPPELVLAAPTNLALVQGTTQQSEVNLADPVRAERADVYDVGITQQLLPECARRAASLYTKAPSEYRCLDIGIDAYFKKARNLIDDGQFGQALVLTAFNYDRAENEGVEFSAKYRDDHLQAYANLSWQRQMATTVVSNQFLFGQAELDYIASHWIFTDHDQRWTGSAGISYLWHDTRFSADLVSGSGLRAGFANTDKMPPYAYANVGISHEFKYPDMKPFTLRFDVVNVTDTVYELRNGSGIGVFAPQFGARRGYFVGLKQTF